MMGPDAPYDVDTCFYPISTLGIFTEDNWGRRPTACSSIRLQEFRLQHTPTQGNPAKTL